MLDVYMDRTMIATFLNGANKARKDKDIDISKLNRYTKAEAFLKKSCKLTLDAEIKTKAGQVLTYFMQGLGENEKPSFDTLTTASVTKNKWSVALLSDSSAIFKEVSKCICTIHKDRLWDDLSTLTFSAPEQATVFPIIPSGHDRFKESTNSLKTFNGWDTFFKHPLVPLTDVILIDSYFLKPEAFKDSYGDYDVQAYVEFSLLPLLKLLNTYALDNQLTINIFTELRLDEDNIADELHDQLVKAIELNGLSIKLVLAVAKHLNQHKRVLYTNYFSLRTELSFYHFQANEVTGFKKDEVSIKPYAVDSPNNDPHSIMLDDLADFYKLIRKPETKIYGDKANLSPMISQAYNQLNQK